MRRDAHIHARLIHRAQKRSPGRRQNQPHAGGGHQILLGRQHGFVHRVDVRAFRRVDVDVEFGFVNICGNVFLLDDAIERNARKRNPDRNHRDRGAMPHGQSQKPAVRTIDN